jgi:hypothetical protein
MVRVQPGVRSGRARLLCDSCFQVYFIDVGRLCDGMPLDYIARYDMGTGKTHCYAVQGRCMQYPVRYGLNITTVRVETAIGPWSLRARLL